MDLRLANYQKKKNGNTTLRKEKNKMLQKQQKLTETVIMMKIVNLKKKKHLSCVCSKIILIMPIHKDRSLSLSIRCYK